MQSTANPDARHIFRGHRSPSVVALVFVYQSIAYACRGHQSARCTEHEQGFHCWQLLWEKCKLSNSA